MFNTIKMFFLNRDKPARFEAVRATYSPPASDLAILDADDLKFENRVIDFLNKKKPYGQDFTINPDTGMLDPQAAMGKLHWSEFSEFAPYARAVTVRTTNWNEKIKLIEKDAIGTTVEAVGAKKLRFYVPFETQLDFLENKNDNHNLMFERDVIHNLSFSIKVINPAELGIITPDYRAIYIEYDGAIYWNSNYQNLSPVEEALIKDYAFFEFHSETPNAEKNYD